MQRKPRIFALVRIFTMHLFIPYCILTTEEKVRKNKGKVVVKNEIATDQRIRVVRVVRGEGVTPPVPISCYSRRLDRYFKTT